MCLESLSAEHRRPGAGPKSQGSKAKMQSEKLQGKEREERGSKEEVPAGMRGGERHRKSCHGAAIPPEEHNGREWEREKTSHQSISALWGHLVWHKQPSGHLKKS